MGPHPPVGGGEDIPGQNRLLRREVFRDGKEAGFGKGNADLFRLGPLQVPQGHPKAVTPPLAQAKYRPFWHMGQSPQAT